MTGPYEAIGDSLRLFVVATFIVVPALVILLGLSCAGMRCPIGVEFSWEGWAEQ